jgi:hypothetical protein
MDDLKIDKNRDYWVSCARYHAAPVFEGVQENLKIAVRPEEVWVRSSAWAFILHTFLYSFY